MTDLMTLDFDKIEQHVLNSMIKERLKEEQEQLEEFLVRIQSICKDVAFIIDKSEYWICGAGASIFVPEKAAADAKTIMTIIKGRQETEKENAWKFRKEDDSFGQRWSYF